MAARDNLFMIRLNAEEKDLLDSVAKSLRLTTAAWARALLLTEADRILAAAQTKARKAK